MKLHIDGVDTNSRSGPNTFATRLARQLFETGHEVVFEKQDAKASLVFIEPSGAPLAQTVVQRLDGIWFSPKDFHTRNVGIKRLYESADAVVFQSRFDQQLIEHCWGSGEERHRPDRVIGNGVSIKPVREFTIPALASLRSSYKRVFVCSSNWHRQKRLRENIELYLRLRALEQNSCLIVMGNNPDCVVADPHVFYAGSVEPDVYMQVYSMADWMIHLAWADHCPNVVVEALSQGTPVICSETGGTKELTGFGAYGMVLKEMYEYKNGLADYDSPPWIDLSQVTFLPLREQLDHSGIPDISIESCAQQYVELIKMVTPK